MDRDLKSVHFLQLLLRSADFARDVAEKFPNLEDSIISFRTSPGCKCRKRMTRYYEENSNCNEFAKKWLDENDHDIDLEAVFANKPIKRKKWKDEMEKNDIRKLSDMSKQKDNESDYEYNKRMRNFLDMKKEDLETFQKERLEKEEARLAKLEKIKQQRPNESDEKYEQRMKGIDEKEKRRKTRFDKLSERIENKLKRELAAIEVENIAKKEKEVEISLEEKIKEKTEKYKPNKEEVADEKIHAVAEKKNVIGEVVEIEVAPQAYKDLIQYVRKQGWFYHGLSVMETDKTEEDGTVKRVWLIFFF